MSMKTRTCMLLVYTISIKDRKCTSGCDMSSCVFSGTLEYCGRPTQRAQVPSCTLIFIVWFRDSSAMAVNCAYCSDLSFFYYVKTKFKSMSVSFNKVISKTCYFSEHNAIISFSSVSNLPNIKQAKMPQFLRQRPHRQEACSEQDEDQSLLTLWWPVRTMVLIQIKYEGEELNAGRSKHTLEAELFAQLLVI